MIVLNIAATEAAAHRLKFGRLSQAADAGDEEARRELERMENTKMVPVKIEVKRDHP